MSPHNLFPPPRCAVCSKVRPVPVVVRGFGRICAKCVTHVANADTALQETEGINGMMHPELYQRNNRKTA